MTFRLPLLLLLCHLMFGAGGGAFAAPPALRIAVLDDAPPMAFRTPSGDLTGFSQAIAQALCDEMKAVCEFEVTRLDHLIDDLAAGRFDVAAVGLLGTPERRQRVLFTKSIYRSITLWFAPPGVKPGDPGVRISVFRGSAQERYVQTNGWVMIGATTVGEMVEQLSAGVAQGMIAPLMTSFSLQKNKKFLQLGLNPVVLHAPELDAHALFGVNPRRDDLREQLDRALDNIHRNGIYDRITTQFLPFRVN